MSDAIDTTDAPVGDPPEDIPLTAVVGRYVKFTRILNGVAASFPAGGLPLEQFNMLADSFSEAFGGLVALEDSVPFTPAGAMPRPPSGGHSVQPVERPLASSSPPPSRILRNPRREGRVREAPAPGPYGLAPPPGPRGRLSYAEAAKAAVRQCSDPIQHSQTALGFLSGNSQGFPSRPRSMRQRMLFHDTQLSVAFHNRLSEVQVLYYRGIRRMAYSALRSMFAALGFIPEDRKLLHFSFLGGGITAIMCVNEAAATALEAVLSGDPKFVQVFLEDPSYPLPDVEGNLPGGSPQFRAQCRRAYISRVVREISSATDLMVATYLQREVASCSQEITELVRPPRGGPHGTGASPQ